MLWMAAIFFASTDELSGAKTSLIIEPFLRWLSPHITREHIELAHLLVRKAGHFGEYAILGLLAARSFSSSRHSLLRRQWFVVSLILLSLYAFSDEFHQSFVPSRTASIYDSLIDIAGGLSALVLIVLWKTIRKQSNKGAAAVDCQYPGIAGQQHQRHDRGGDDSGRSISLKTPKLPSSLCLNFRLSLRPLRSQRLSSEFSSDKIHR
jgi:VanZ family protein